GHVLLALLEELSGCKLLHGFKKSSHRIFRLNNIAKVLSFLEERNVKLVSIDAADVADGNSSIILGLIWNIILFFQIKELTGNIRSQFPSCSSLSSLPNSSDSDTSSSTPSEERQTPANPLREHSRAIKKLLQWVQRRTRKYGVAVQDFGKSWTSGLAFLAVIKSIDSSLVDMRKALLRTPRENLEDAFRIAHYSLGIPRLLEPEDVTLNAPDEQSIIMYVSQFLEHFPGIEEVGGGVITAEIRNKDHFGQEESDLKHHKEGDNAPTTGDGSTPNSRPAADMTIPLISISSEPDDQCLSGSDLEENYGSDEFGQAKVSESKEVEDENDGVIASCFITENIDLIASEETSDYKNGHFDEEFEVVEASKDGDEYVEIIEDVQEEIVSQNVLKNHLVCSNLQSGLESDETEQVIFSDQREGLCTTVSATEAPNTQETSTDTVKSNGNAVPIANDSANAPEAHLYKDYKEELVDLEPMDLFYPDKDVPPYVEPAEDVQSWPSVLSVSPLQPAPASLDLSDEPTLTRPEEDWSGEEVKSGVGQVISDSDEFINLTRAVCLSRKNTRRTNAHRTWHRNAERRRGQRKKAFELSQNRSLKGGISRNKCHVLKVLCVTYGVFP
uniref:Calponin-homology (CH) domain-containing protein n=1 Tax=Periophthalmus magnuspinnatus TaxID=409849 RepID=A0A3B4A6K8_9GOBI